MTYIKSTKKNRNPHAKNVAARIVYANITGLRANRRYNVTVLASNVNGDGPSSEIVIITTNQDSKFGEIYVFSLLTIIIKQSNPLL